MKNVILNRIILFSLLIFTSTIHAEEYYAFSIEAMNTLHTQQRHFFLHPPYWQPDDNANKEALIALKKYLSTAEPGRVGNDIFNKFETYKFQIFGYSEGDNKLMYINAFCTDEPNWQKYFVFVFDGGTCFWHATWNPTSKAVIDFLSNGQA